MLFSIRTKQPEVQTNRKHKDDLLTSRYQATVAGAKAT